MSEDVRAEATSVSTFIYENGVETSKLSQLLLFSVYEEKTMYLSIEYSFNLLRLMIEKGFL